MTRREALSLFAHILRLHRQKLPFEMRQLGDTYVKFVALRAPHAPPCASHRPSIPVKPFSVQFTRPLFFSNAQTLLALLARKEFRLHKNADARFVQSFLAEWRHYAATLEAQQTLEVVGAPLDAHLMGVLSDEQKDQLNKLEAEARRMQ